MKFALLLFTLIFSPLSFSIDYPEGYLDHLDIIHLDEANNTKLDFAINYPGLGSFNSNVVDCLILHTGKTNPTDKQLEDFMRQIHLADGDGILFPGGNFRNINVLEGKIIGFRHKKIKFDLRDLGKYVTGFRVSTYSPYISIAQVTKAIFKDDADKVFLQFLRRCEI